MTTENTEQRKSALKLFDEIDNSLKKANAIARLMAFAANNSDVILREEYVWAVMVHGDLIDQATRSADAFLTQAAEHVGTTASEATA